MEVGLGDKRLLTIAGYVREWSSACDGNTFPWEFELVFEGFLRARQLPLVCQGRSVETGE